MFFPFFLLKPCLRRFSDSQWAFFPLAVWRYRLWALRRLLRLPAIRHSSLQYTCPLKHRRQTQKTRWHQPHSIRTKYKIKRPPTLQTDRSLSKINLVVCFGLPTVCGTPLESSKSPLRAFAFLSSGSDRYYDGYRQYEKKVCLVFFLLGRQRKGIREGCSHRKMTLKEYPKWICFNFVLVLRYWGILKGGS